jgi:hypothetical protein
LPVKADDAANAQNAADEDARHARRIRRGRCSP